MPDEYLRDCWAPKIADANALARLHEHVASGPLAVAEPWVEAGRVRLALAELPELEVETRLAMHGNTVMDLAVAPSGQAASVDFSGRWSVWSQADLREEIHGDFRREVRAISLNEDGTRLAALVNLGPAALYDYDAFIVALEGGDPIHCPGESTHRIRWEGDFLLLASAVGYRVHRASGELICSDISPKGLSATCFVRGELRCIRRNVLGGVELGTDRALPCLDLSTFDRNGYHWRSAGLDIRRSGDLVALGPATESVFVLELSSGRNLVSLEIQDVQIVGMKLAFDASGRYLLMSATHIRGEQVTHLVYDGRRGVIIGKLTTAPRLFGAHARVVMSNDCTRVFAADGTAIAVACVRA